LEDKDNEEYKNRIKELIERVETYKEKSTPEIYQQIFDGLERLKEVIFPNMHDKYRNVKVMKIWAISLRNIKYAE